MPKGFFVTGTDTGVGKTVVAAALIKAAGLLDLDDMSDEAFEKAVLKNLNMEIIRKYL